MGLWASAGPTWDGGPSGGSGGAFTGGGGGAEPDAAVGAGGGPGGAAGTGIPAPGLGWRDLSPRCVFPKPAPIFDFAPMLAFDRARRKLMLYAGRSRSDADLPPAIVPGVPATNLWELDADSGAWTDRTRCLADGFVAQNGAMVYDTQRRRLVIFTGTNGNVGEWDPSTSRWTDRPFPFDGTPFPGGAPLAAVYDEARGKAIVFIEFDVVFGGIAAWEWDPVGRWLLDDDRGLLVLAGGTTGEARVSDLWERTRAARPGGGSPTRPPTGTSRRRGQAIRSSSPAAWGPS